MSQITLAEGLGISFQQVQKYEKGTNRISASKLYRSATLLGVPVAYFFEGIETGGLPAPDENTRMVLDTSKQLQNLKPKTLKMVHEIVRNLAKLDQDDDGNEQPPLPQSLNGLDANLNKLDG